MKKFFFRLETVLNIRLRSEARVLRELEFAKQRWAAIKEEAKTLKTQIDSLSKELHEKRFEKRLDLQQTYCHILENLQKELAQVQHNLLLHTQQLEEHKERLKQAVQERKIIEKIKEKHYTGWRLKQSKSEGAALDEIALKKPINIK